MIRGTTAIVLATVIASLGFGVACAPDAAAPPGETGPAEPVLDMHHLMELVLDPPADFLWDSAGTIITAEGATELAPTTEAGWTAVADQAAVLAEVSNLLVLSGRSRGPGWDQYAVGLRAAAERVQEAAEARDPDALFDAGGDLYQVCRGCHQVYWRAEQEAPPFE